MRVLLINHRSDESQRFRRMLEAATDVRFEIAQALRVEEGLLLLRDGKFSAVLLDLSLEESEGIDTLAPARVAAENIPFVVLGDEDDEDLAVRAHRFGAQDYLVKTDCDTRLLVRTLRHARERHRILTDLAQSRRHEHYPSSAMPSRSTTSRSSTWAWESPWAPRRCCAGATRSGESFHPPSSFITPRMAD
jgi:DNA-binding NarL/FixJ family response regulator